ncbi:hypothetical protein Q3G72_017601 [Acer saccharum]|nr:hypothetical protein Q3G72_017601 [Acer saccharum]
MGNNNSKKLWEAIRDLFAAHNGSNVVYYKKELRQAQKREATFEASPYRASPQTGHSNELDRHVQLTQEEEFSSSLPRSVDVSSSRQDKIGASLESSMPIQEDQEIPETIQNVDHQIIT